jgi:hypothetical protein
LVKYQDYYLSTGREVDPAATIAEALKRTPPPGPVFAPEKMIAAFPRNLLSHRRRLDRAGR